MNQPPEVQLENAFEHINDPALQRACRNLLEDHRFAVWPAAIGHHHNYEGGLLAHTVEVLWYARTSASNFPKEVNRDVLIAACLWHDYAKVREYGVVEVPFGSKVPEEGLLYRTNEASFSQDWWVKSDYLKKVGHIAGSTAVFYHAAVSEGVAEETIDAVCHAILAHHGPVLEWGSPVAPQSLEAILLHQADILSARYGATRKTP